MSYIVETYEEFEARSDPSVPINFIHVGNFQTAEDAVEAAKGLIRKGIAALVTEGRSVEAAIRSYRIFGEIPVIRGEPAPDFNALEFMNSLSVDEILLFALFGVKP